MGQRGSVCKDNRERGRNRGYRELVVLNEGFMDEIHGGAGIDKGLVRG